MSFMSSGFWMHANEQNMEPAPEHSKQEQKLSTKGQ